MESRVSIGLCSRAASLVCVFMTCVLVLMPLHRASADQANHVAGVLTPDDFFHRLGERQECRFVGRFEQSKYLAGLTDAIDSSGQFLFDCERGVIWLATLPASDALILARPASSKTRAYRHIDGELQKLNNRQGRFLSELIMSLMSADLVTLSAQFELQSIDDSSVMLLPKKRRLKRALKHITISVAERQVPRMEIVIIDRNDQKTEITSVKEQSFDAFSQSGCTEVGFERVLCDLLFDSQTDQSATAVGNDVDG